MATGRSGFAAAMRAAMQEISQTKQGGIDLGELAMVLDLVGKEDKKPMYRALRDFVRAGEVERVSSGVYRYLGNRADRTKPQLREVMWRILRARKAVTLDDLQELAGASRAYASEWIRMLERQEVVVKQFSGGDKFRWVLMADSLDAPTDDAKREKLRQIRERKKEALKKIDEAVLLVLDIRLAIAETMESGA